MPDEPCRSTFTPWAGGREWKAFTASGSHCSVAPHPETAPQTAPAARTAGRPSRCHPRDHFTRQRLTAQRQPAMPGPAAFAPEPWSWPVPRPNAQRRRPPTSTRWLRPQLPSTGGLLDPQGAERAGERGTGTHLPPRLGAIQGVLGLRSPRTARRRSPSSVTRWIPGHTTGYRPVMVGCLFGYPGVAEGIRPRAGTPTGVCDAPGRRGLLSQARGAATARQSKSAASARGSRHGAPPRAEGSVQPRNGRQHASSGSVRRSMAGSAAERSGHRTAARRCRRHTRRAECPETGKIGTGQAESVRWSIPE